MKEKESVRVWKRVFLSFMWWRISPLLCSLVTLDTSYLSVSDWSLFALTIWRGFSRVCSMICWERKENLFVISHLTVFTATLNRHTHTSSFLSSILSSSDICLLFSITLTADTIILDFFYIVVILSVKFFHFVWHRLVIWWSFAVVYKYMHPACRVLQHSVILLFWLAVNDAKTCFPPTISWFVLNVVKVALHRYGDCSC